VKTRKALENQTLLFVCITPSCLAGLAGTAGAGPERIPADLASKDKAVVETALGGSQSQAVVHHHMRQVGDDSRTRRGTMEAGPA
jgi:hypothetical protein